MNSIFDGMSRRHFLKHLSAVGMTVPMANWINSVHAARAAGKASKTRSMILLWMGGGPATIDIWDLKPGSKNGGEFKPIATTGEGKICEHLPKLATQMKHLNIIRSYNSRDGAHERGTYINHTAFAPVASVTHPAMGSIVAKYNGSETMEIPGHISLGGPGVSPGFLGTALAPFRVEAGANPIPNLKPTVEQERAIRRAGYLQAAEKAFIKENRGKLPEDHSVIYNKAFTLMSSKLLDAFKIDLEDAKTKERYGTSQFGKNCLLARRLVEIGVPFIEVGFGGWDMHQNIHRTLKTTLPQLDQGFASLVEDLAARGLMSSTSICWMGDFGRTPKINQDGGRDHWPGSWSVVLGGGSMKGGQVVGATDSDGVAITERPVEVSNLFATLYQSLGIQPSTELRSPNGRPIKLVGVFGDGKPVEELF